MHRANEGAGPGLPGSCTLVTTGTANSSQMNAEISGDRIVWEDYRNGDADIYLYSAGSGIETRITNDSSDQKYPVISGDNIAWLDYRNGAPEIYLYNLQTSALTTVTNSSTPKMNPAMSGSIIVWEEFGRDLSILGCTT